MTAEWQQDVVIPGRIAAGIAYGLIYITALIHTSETASKEFRHLLVLNVGYIFALSTLVMAVISVSTYELDGLQSNVALLTAIYASVALIINYRATQESPIFLLQHPNADSEDASTEEAFEVFRVLQKLGMHSSEVHRRFSQLREYVMEASLQSRNIFGPHNIKAMILACCIRLTTALSLNLGIVFIALNMMFFVLSNDSTQILRISFLVWFVCGSSTIFLFYKYKARNYVYFAALAFGMISTVNILMLILAIDFIIFIFMYVIAVALRAYVLFCSLPLEILGGIYLSETFALSRKPFSMATILCIENLAHILMTFFVLDKSFIPFWFITSLSLIGLGFKLSWSIPKDTHKMTLQDSANAFSNTSAREWYTRANVNSRAA